MTSLILIWAGLGLIGVAGVLYYDYVNVGYITVGSLGREVLNCLVLGPIAAAMGIFCASRTLLERIDWSFLGKKILVKKRGK